MYYVSRRSGGCWSWELVYLFLFKYEAVWFLVVCMSFLEFLFAGGWHGYGEF